MGVQFNFDAGRLDRVWSRSPEAGVTISSVVTSIGSGSTAPPSLLVNYLTPPLISQGQIPKSVDYQYYKCETFVNDMNATLAPNATQQFTNNAIQLSTVPRSIYIYATRPDNTKTHLTTDTFLRINSLSLNYLNTAGQFSSMPIQSLYQMAVKNGCDLSWNEWSGKTQTIGDASVDGMVGSVLKIDVSDLHIPSNIASGMNVNSQLSYTIGLENVNQVDTLGVQITTVIIYDGIMSVSNGSMATSVGIIGEADVLAVRADRMNYVDYKSAQNIYAGSLFSSLGHMASMGKRGLDAVCNIKDSLGMGGARCPKGSQKGMKCAPVRACVPKKGGELMSRSQLKARLFD